MTNTPKPTSHELASKGDDKAKAEQQNAGIQDCKSVCSGVKPCKRPGRKTACCEVNDTGCQRIQRSRDGREGCCPGKSKRIGVWESDDAGKY